MTGCLFFLMKIYTAVLKMWYDLDRFCKTGGLSASGGELVLQQTKKIQVNLETGFDARGNKG